MNKYSIILAVKSVLRGILLNTIVFGKAVKINIDITSKQNIKFN